MQVQGVGQHRPVLVTGDLPGAEAAEVPGDELRVDEGEAAGTQPGDEMDERDLAGVAGAAEHAFAEEDAAQRDPVETADQHTPLPPFTPVRTAPLDQRGINR